MRYTKLTTRAKKNKVMVLLIFLAVACSFVLPTRAIFTPQFDAETKFQIGDTISVSFILDLENGLEDHKNDFIDMVNNSYGGSLAYTLSYKADVVEIKDYKWGTMTSTLINGEAAFRIRENRAHADGITRDTITATFYGNTEGLASGEFFAAEYVAISNGELDDIKLFTASNIENEVVINVIIIPKGGATTASYTIAATTAATAPQASGDPFSVYVKLTADPTTALYATAEAKLAYNPDLVVPILDGLTNVSDSETPGKLTITHNPKNGEDVAVGADVAALATIPFAPKAQGTAVFTVSEDAVVCLAGQEGAEIPAAPGAPLEVEIGAAAPTFTFDDQYGALPSSDYQLLMYQLSAAPVNVWTYGGETMHYVYTDGKHYVTYIVEDTVDADNALTPVESSKPIVLEDADVNGSGTVRISDAQIIYDIINNHANYSALSGLSIAYRLGADVNNDGIVDIKDANAVIDAIHGRAQ
jgi:hypothetical protein